MTKSRRFCLLALATCLLFLTACQGQDSQLGKSGNILLWHSAAPNTKAGQAFQASIDSYQQLHPEIYIVTEYVPEAVISQRFINEVQAGLGPDIMVNFASEIPALVRAKTLKALNNNEVDPSKFSLATLKQVQYQGQFYGIPLANHLQVLCYNKNKLMAAASSLQPPTTLAELLMQGKKGYSVGIVSTLIDTWWGVGIFGGKIFSSEGLPQPQIQGWEKWITWLKEANGQPNIILNSDRNILKEAFKEQRLTYYICQTTELSELKVTLKDNLGVALLPGEPKRPASPILYGRALLFNDASSIQQSQIALDLAHFITNSEQQMLRTMAVQSFIPSNKIVQLDTRLLPREGILMEQAKTAVVIPLDYIDSTLRIAEKGDLVYQQVIAGGLTPQEAALQLEQIIHTELERE